ncbi:MAG: hypothetical protein H7A51_14355 [Akkermansiaceae bacterium]|nr:hypothetical protein [Akkermansiaceae bacterium]
MRNMYSLIRALAATTLLAGSSLYAADAEKPAETDTMKALQAYVGNLEGEQREAGEFLLKYMPKQDRGTLSLELFRENLEQAYIAREQYPWAKALPKELFFNDVLPYALIDETRDPWRKRLRELYEPKVKDCKDIREVSEVIGGQIVKLTGVNYDTKREKACQSPAESLRQGMASCTGLSILMADSLRACGVPARLAGIPLWGTLEGNHTWIEIHDGTGWNMSDYGSVPKEWNKGWAIERCAYSDPARPIHGIFATSYRSTKLMYPLIWDWKVPASAGRVGNDQLYAQQRDQDGKLTELKWVFQKTPVYAVDRTEKYIAMAGGRKIPIPKGQACVTVRAFVKGTDARVDVPVRASRDGKRIFEGRTATSTQDLNDYIRIICPPGELTVEYQDAAGKWLPQTVQATVGKEESVKIELAPDATGGVFSVEQRRALASWFRSGGAAWPADVTWPTPKDPAEVAKMRAVLWSIFREAARKNRYTDELGPLPPLFKDMIADAKAKGGKLNARSITLGKEVMPFALVRKETKPVPAGGRALYICLHGGGGFDQAPSPHGWEVNTREWQAQIHFAANLYDAEGVFFVPRMANDRRGRWWFAHNQDAFDWLISHAIREWNVDPDRVYLMGISEGCYGTQIDGPFMADRFAAANAMAGGVGDDVPAENVCNLPFRTDVGENDTTFDRVGLARKFHARMDAAKKKFGGSYINHLEVQPGKGHGIDYRPGTPWMIQHTRKPKPETVVWKAQPLDNRRREAFYWLGLDSTTADKEPILIVGKLDRAKNSVDIKVTDAAEKPLSGRQLWVMLDNTMLDLSKPVTIYCNGKEVFKGTATRSVEAMARTLMQRSDPELTFPVRLGIKS